MATDPYFRNVSLLLHGDGANNGTVFTDSSRNNFGLTRSGTVVTSTAQAKYGTASINFSASSSRLSITNNAFVFNNDNFTVEFWFYTSTGSKGQNNSPLVMIDGSVGYGEFFLYSVGVENPMRLALLGNNGSWIGVVDAPATTISNDAWHHIAVTRNGNLFTIWVDGAVYNSNTVSCPFTQNTLYIGNDNANAAQVIGYYDDFRITNGVCRYTAPFTPPTEAFPDKMQWVDTVSQALTFTEAQTFGKRSSDTLSDQTVVDGSSVSVGLGKIFTDSYKFLEFTQLSRNISATEIFKSFDRLTYGFSPGGFSDSFTLSESQVTDWIWAGDVLEDLNCSDEYQFKTIYAPVVVDDLTALSELLACIPVNTSETVNFTEQTKVIRGMRILDRMLAQDLIQPNAINNLTVRERWRIYDSLANFFAGDITEAFSFLDALASKYRVTPTMAESVTATDTLTSKFILRLAASDTVNIDDIEILKYVFSPTLQDSVHISAAYISPNSTIATWVINTENGYVTEYTNYAFNSFAELNNTYMAASETGLYSLAGDDDDGTDIVAHLKSGLAQMGGSRFTSFAAAYLGLRGGGDWVLKVVTGDGKEYVYSVVAQDMQTTKVRLGKGLRARYFAFELISTGQDFDLDNIEFIPLIAKRRV